jgi:hypothetical protein
MYSPSVLLVLGVNYFKNIYILNGTTRFISHPVFQTPDLIFSILPSFPIIKILGQLSYSHPILSLYH